MNNIEAHEQNQEQEHLFWEGYVILRELGFTGTPDDSTKLLNTIIHKPGFGVLFHDAIENGFEGDGHDFCRLFSEMIIQSQEENLNRNRKLNQTQRGNSNENR